MALDVAAVRKGIERTLQDPLGSYVQIATAPDQITPPCLYIGMPTVLFNQSFAKGLDVMNIPIMLLLPRTHDQAAVDQADALISGDGPSSLRHLLQEDQSLRGSCQTCVLNSATPDFYQGATGELPSYSIDLEVYG